MFRINFLKIIIFVFISKCRLKTIRKTTNCPEYDVSKPTMVFIGVFKDVENIFNNYYDDNYSKNKCEYLEIHKNNYDKFIDFFVMSIQSLNPKNQIKNFDDVFIERVEINAVWRGIYFHQTLPLCVRFKGIFIYYIFHRTMTKEYTPREERKEPFPTKIKIVFLGVSTNCDPENHLWPRNHKNLKMNSGTTINDEINRVKTTIDNPFNQILTNQMINDHIYAVFDIKNESIKPENFNFINLLNIVFIYGIRYPLYQIGEHDCSDFTSFVFNNLTGLYSFPKDGSLQNKFYSGERFLPNLDLEFMMKTYVLNNRNPMLKK